MIKYIAVSFVLGLAACGQSGPPPSPVSAENYAARTAGDPAPGAWLFLEPMDGYASAGYGASDAAFLLNVQCEASTRNVTIIARIERDNREAAPITIVTDRGALEFDGVTAEGIGDVIGATIRAPDARLTALAGAEGRLALEAGGQSHVIPGDPSIARALALCGVTTG